jgi:hypothetical protein
MPNAEDFIKELHTNATLRDKVHNAAEGIAKVANENGYPGVTREQISDALQKHWTTNTNPPDPIAAPTGPAPDLTQCALKFSEVPGF